MHFTTNQEVVEKQKKILKSLYPDYDARHHLVFVLRYQKEQDEKALAEYMKSRGI